MTMLETRYQADLKNKIHDRFPGCFILENDPQETQGLPDLLILFEDRWAMLEVKRSASSRTRPNQPYYIDLFGAMSFAAFIYPENEEQVLNELQSAFGVSR